MVQVGNPAGRPCPEQLTTSTSLMTFRFILAVRGCTLTHRAQVCDTSTSEPWRKATWRVLVSICVCYDGSTRCIPSRRHVNVVKENVKCCTTLTCLFNLVHYGGLNINSRFYKIPFPCNRFQLEKSSQHEWIFQDVNCHSSSREYAHRELNEPVQVAGNILLIIFHHHVDINRWINYTHYVITAIFNFS